MILDRWDHFARYQGLHPGFAAAQAALQIMWNEPPAPGRHAIDGERLFIIVARDNGRGPDRSPLEFHRKYIDIQLVLADDDLMGWRPLEDCRHLQQAYDHDRDLGFFSDRPHLWLPVPRGHFAIFYPEDAHAPLATRGAVTKAVAKVACSW